MAKEKIIKRQGNVILKKVEKIFWVYVLPDMRDLKEFEKYTSARQYFDKLLKEIQ